MTVYFGKNDCALAGLRARTREVESAESQA